MQPTHIITGPHSLKRALWLRRGTRIALALPTFTVVQQENLEARFNRRLSDSGSELCILALITALVGSILFDAARWDAFTAHDTRMIAANVLVCLTATVFGRILGCLRARWQLAPPHLAVAERLEDDIASSPLAVASAPRGERFLMHHRSAPNFTRATF